MKPLSWNCQIRQAHQSNANVTRSISWSSSRVWSAVLQWLSCCSKSRQGLQRQQAWCCTGQVFILICARYDLRMHRQISVLYSRISSVLTRLRPRSQLWRNQAHFLTFAALYPGSSAFSNPRMQRICLLERTWQAQAIVAPIGRKNLRCNNGSVLEGLRRTRRSALICRCFLKKTRCICKHQKLKILWLQARQRCY